MPAMDIFVVRVSQSSRSQPGLRGVVDEVASGLRFTFHDPENLMMILLGEASDGAASQTGAAGEQSGQK
jgi:hypothetical protein